MAIIDDLFNVAGFLKGINFELGEEDYEDDPPTPLEEWIRLKPMRLRKPKSVGQFSRVLGSLGLGNRIDPRSHEEKMIEIHAVTMTGVNEFGEQVQHTCVLDPAWTDVTSGEIPWERADERKSKRRR